MFLGGVVSSVSRLYLHNSLIYSKCNKFENTPPKQKTLNYSNIRT